MNQPTLDFGGVQLAEAPLHLDDVADTLHQRLSWPEDDHDAKGWREKWQSAFTLRHLEVITTSKDLAVRLAELARAIRDRIKTVLAIETAKGPLTKLMKAFQQALIHDLTADDFADMYAQTIAYGLLSARLAHPAHDTTDAVATHIPVTNPFLKELMETFLHLGGRKRKERGGDGIDFDELGVSEVVELLDAANMEAVVHDFGDRNRDEDPVIHFYELFLKEYDAKKRMQRGVFYTPQPVVSYIVRSVHELLQTEFGLEDGLASTDTWGDIAAKHAGLKMPDGVSPADSFVVILDPATGTAAFLVEVIDIIYLTLTAKWKQQRLTEAQQSAAWNAYVPKHLLPRLHGYELLMAPYAIAHMKIGLKLYETGYRFGSDERARIYLTNALEPASDAKEQREFEEWVPALAHETQAVNEIKRKQRFTVVIGNPPYANRGMMNKNGWILKLLDEYKTGLTDKKLNLDDDFIKFIRYGHHLLVLSGYGIFSLISSNTFLDGVTHRRMRESLLAYFPFIRVLDLHGNSQKGDISPDGSADENVFDIRQGVAITTLTRPIEVPDASHAHHHQLWGIRNAKYKTLLTSRPSSLPWSRITPTRTNFFLVPSFLNKTSEYETFFKTSEMFIDGNNGFVTDRDDLFIDFEPMPLTKRMQHLFGGKLTPEFVERYRVVASSSYDLPKKIARGSFDSESIRRCLYRPFDIRSIYYSRSITSRPAYDVMRQMSGDNVGLVLARLIVRSEAFDACFVSRHITEKKCGDSTRSSYLFPLYRVGSSAKTMPGALFREQRQTNLTRTIIDELTGAFGLSFVGERHGDLTASFGPEDLFGYVYAILHSPRYRERYGEWLKIDFPRVPIGGSQTLFCALARLGTELVALHLLESPRLDKPLTTYTGPTNPEVEKISYARDTVWLNKAQTRGFCGVPEAVWNFHIGGYQVCEKWLKDRKGRTLSKDDIAHYHKIVVALCETIRLMREIDEVIEKHGGWPGAFQSTKVRAEAP